MASNSKRHFICKTLSTYLFPTTQPSSLQLVNLKILTKILSVELGPICVAVVIICYYFVLFLFFALLFIIYFCFSCKN